MVCQNEYETLLVLLQAFVLRAVLSQQAASSPKRLTVNTITVLFQSNHEPRAESETRQALRKSIQLFKALH